MEKYKCSESSCGYSSKRHVDFWHCDYCSGFVCRLCMYRFEGCFCFHCEALMCEDCSENYLRLGFIKRHSSCELGGGVS